MKLLRNMSIRFDNQIASKKGLTAAEESEETDETLDIVKGPFGKRSHSTTVKAICEREKSPLLKVSDPSPPNWKALSRVGSIRNGDSLAKQEISETESNTRTRPPSPKRETVDVVTPLPPKLPNRQSCFDLMKVCNEFTANRNKKSRTNLNENDKSIKQIIFDLNKELMLEGIYANRLKMTDGVMSKH